MKLNQRPPTKTQSVRKRILLPLGGLLLCLLLLLCAVLLGSGLLNQLNQDAIAGLQGRVIGRANQLQSQMAGRWSDLGYTSRSINALYDQMASTQAVTPHTLAKESTQYSAFLIDAAPHLIYLMRNAGVTGAFIVLAGEQYPAGLASVDDTRPCLYFSDRDPVSPYTDENTDLLLKYAPVDTARALEIPYESDWVPLLPIRAGAPYPDYVAAPYNAALADPSLPASLCGYWSEPHAFPGSQDESISYSMPLVAEDGALYGTLGVEVSLRFLQSQLPSFELGQSANGVYHLFAQAKQKDAPPIQSTIAVCGPAYGNTLDDINACVLNAEVPAARMGIDAVCFYQHPLRLYNTNSPFAQTEWVLAGGLPGYTLFDTTRKTLVTFVLVIGGVSLLCFIGLLAISRLVTRPVERLSQQVLASNAAKTLTLHKTGITEIDMLASSIETMSREVHQFANQFSDIINMSSIAIGGFDYNKTDGSLFVSDNFFGVFGAKGLHATGMSVKEFDALLDSYKQHHVTRRTVEEKGESKWHEHLFALPQPNGSTLWTRLRYFWRDDRCVGLAEDVTAERCELDKIAFERDHDVLTGLMNRRAWYRQVNALFAETHQLKNAVMLMIDLDNLKFVNDTYGHDAGDAYICAAADALRAALPADAVLCRKSGDEFLAFLYGYDAKHDLRALLPQVHETFRGVKIPLKNGRYYPLRASGGTAWYPNDTTDLGNLIRYADFAMYKAKNSAKGDICNFELTAYERESYILQGTQALDEMIEHALVDYYFQPIVDARTGEVAAYEALMRPRVDGLRSPADVLNLARRDGKLEGIERLTWFCAMDAFVQHCRQGFVSETCRVFINSVPSSIMTNEDIMRFADRFRDYLHRIVQEQTEEERPGSACQRRKLEVLQSWGAGIALDDYGSGYSNEKALLLLRPNYVKLDMGLVTGIEESPQQQQMVANLVQYAANNNVRIIAEGVETQQEATQLIRLGVHYLQGYYLARPALIPPLLPTDVVQMITRCNAPMLPALPD